MIIVYLASLLVGIFGGITESINKNITEEKYSVFSYSFIQAFLNFLIYTILFIFFGSLPKDPIAYLYVSIVAIFCFAGNLFLIKAYKTEDISNINIISRVSLIIAFISGAVLLNEHITKLKILGVLSIISGVLVIFYQGKKLKLSPGLIFALLSGIAFGMLSYFDKKSLLYFDPLSMLFVFCLILSVLHLIVPKTYKDIDKIVAKYKKEIIFSRIFAVCTFYLLMWSIQRGNISIVNTNNETAFLLSTVFIGIIFLNEKENILRKLAGSLLCILGIILLNFF